MHDDDEEENLKELPEIVMETFNIYVDMFRDVANQLLRQRNRIDHRSNIILWNKLHEAMMAADSAHDRLNRVVRKDLR